MRTKLLIGLLLAGGMLSACGPKPPPCTGQACPAAPTSSQAGGSY